MTKCEHFIKKVSQGHMSVTTSLFQLDTVRRKYGIISKEIQTSNGESLAKYMDK